MAYTAATAASFKVRFPAFVAVDDALITSALDRARLTVDSTWIEADRQEAENLHAAHELTLDGQGATREAQLQGFRRLKLGSLELEREAGADAAGIYALTTFGQRFLALLKRSQPGVIAIGG